MSTFGERLVEERKRLRMNQAEVATVVACSTRAIGSYERGERSPDAEQLIKFSEMGMDIYYVLMGERVTERLDLDPMQRAVLDDFDRCSMKDKIEAVRYLALLAEGVKPPAPPKPARKKKSK